MKEIKLTQGKVALVDNENFEFLNQCKWQALKTKQNTFYATRTIRKNGYRGSVQMHRIILGLTDKTIFIDHKDGDGLNNCKSNLRIATRSQNAANRRRRKHSSKYHGVSKLKTNRWHARLMNRNKDYHLGFFKTEKEAALAYDAAAQKLHGEFATLNFKL